MVRCIIPFRENTDCCVDLKNAQSLGINSSAAVPGLSVPHDNHFVSLEMLVK